MKSCSLSSYTPSEDSVFTADSRMDELGIGAGLGPTGWKIQPSLDSSSTDEEVTSSSEKGLYTGESLKDFFELVMSPSDEMTRDLEKINLVDQPEQVPRGDTQVRSISSREIRTRTNSSEIRSCEGRLEFKGLELNLQNPSIKVDSLSPSRELAIGFEKINLRERTGSDASTQDTYFGPPTPNRNSLERGSVRPEEFVGFDQEDVAKWLEDLIDRVTQPRYFKTPKNQSFEERDSDRLLECSFNDKSYLESTTFKSNGKSTFLASEKNQSKNNGNGSVAGFLEEIVNSVAQDFAKTMSFGVESPERQNVEELNELCGVTVVGSFECGSSPVTCPEVVIIESAAEMEMQAQDDLPSCTGVAGAHEPQTGVNSALDVVSEPLRAKQEMQAAFVNSASKFSDKDCETDISTYRATDSELMETERTYLDEQNVEFDTSSDSSFSIPCVAGDQTSLTVEGVLEAHTEAHFSSSEDLINSKSSLLSNQSESDRDPPVESPKQARSENGSTSKSEEDVRLDGLCTDLTVNELPSKHSNESDLHQKEDEGSLEDSGSERQLPKAQTDAPKVAAETQGKDVLSVNYESVVTSESERLSRVPLSDVTPGTDEGNPKSPLGTECTQRTLTRDELSRSQADIINAVSEAFQDIVDSVADSDTEREMEETKL